MPVLALAVADVLVRDLNPGIALGLGDHALDEAAVSLLDVGAPGDLGLGIADANEESVADPLQLSSAEDAGAANGSNGPIDSLARERGGPKLGELLLEAGDLAAKLVADGPLVLGGEEIKWHLCPAASDCRLVSERFSHHGNSTPASRPRQARSPPRPRCQARRAPGSRR